jgi:hypothetical protein
VRSAVVLALIGLLLALGTLLARSAAGSSTSIDVCPPAAGGSHGPSLGTVLDFRSSAYVRNSNRPGDSVYKRFKLFAGNSVCTNDFGEITFHAQTAATSTTCDAGADARFSLAVKKKKLLINLLAKTSRSTIGCDSENVVFNSPQNRSIDSSPGPVFVIRVGPQQSVITVGQGFVRLGPQTDGGGAEIVGPNEQTTISTGKTKVLAAPHGQRLDSLQRKLLGKFEAGLPPPVYGRPRSQTALRTSRTLQRIGRTRAIVIGLGPSLTGSDAGDFVRAYFSFLAQHWFPARNRKVSCSFPGGKHVVQKCSLLRDVAPGQARNLLKTGKLEVYISQKPPSGTLTAPFFADHAGAKWSFVVKSDPVFLRALTTFLQSALDFGDYDRLYRSSLAKQPPVYQAVESLIFPRIVCAPRANADLISDVDLALKLSASPSGPVLRGTKFVQTATVLNVGQRIVDCVTLNFHIFGGLPLNYAELRNAGCTRVDLPSGQGETGELDLSCELGRLALGARKSLGVVVRPSASSAHTETCADVNADESGGLPEVKRADNSACAQIVYRDAPLAVGVVEDNAKQPADPAAKVPAPLGTLDPQAKFDLLGQAGFGAVVLTAGWVRAESAPSFVEIAKLKNAVTAAKLAGMDVVLAVYNFGKGLTAAQDTPVTAAERADFAAYAAALARALPTVREFIVGNEPNNEQFWSPQYGRGGSDVAAPGYEALLARTYDALKAVDPTITVIGGALAPRGAEQPKPGVHDSHSATTFISDLGSAYRRGARTGPIMDAFALHPISQSPDVPPTTQHPRPSTELGIADYPVLVSLLGHAFDGTGQVGSTLPIYYTEYAIQTTIPPGVAGYVGKRGATVSEKTQADFYRQAIALASCQPSVKGIFFFHGFDETQLTGWQSGVYYANGTPKSSLSAVRAAALAARTRTVSSCPPGARIP